MDKSLYPRDSFVNDIRRIRALKTTGGWRNPGDTLQLKYVMPRFRHGVENRYDIQSALVVYQTNIHDDLTTALVPKAIVKGVGSPGKPAQRRSSELIRHGADVIVGQIGMGSLSGLVCKLRDMAYGVVNSSRYRIDLNVDGDNLGVVDISTRVLPGTKYLERNGFPADEFSSAMESELPESGVILVQIQACFTPEQVDSIFKKANNSIDPQYGVPRLVTRIDLPETELGNIGASPHAILHTASRHILRRNRRSLQDTLQWGRKVCRYTLRGNRKDLRYALQWDRRVSQTKGEPNTQKVPLEPVRYAGGKALEISYQGIIDSSLSRLRHIFSNNPELQMRHLAHRLNEVYTRCVRRVLAICRSKGFNTEIEGVTNCFTAAFSQFCLDKENEMSVGGVYTGLPLSSAKASREGKVGVFMESWGDEPLDQMMKELEMTCRVSRDPQDYILRLCEAGELKGGKGADVLISQNELHNAIDPDLLVELANKRIEDTRGAIKGRKRAWKRNNRKKKEQGSS